MHLVCDEWLAVGENVDFAALVVSNKPIKLARRILCMNEETDFACVFARNSARPRALLSGATAN